MLTAKEIRDKAERSYKDFLSSVLKREAFFPLHIKGNKGNANLPFAELYPALKHLIDHSKEKIGHGYTLTYKEVNTRQSGIITMPNEIFFQNIQDFLKFIEKENDFLAFRKALDATKRVETRHALSVQNWIENNILKCQKHASDWEGILKIVQYFIQNPKPNCYWRQLPIDVDLAAMEAHQPLIGELLETVLPPNQFNINELQFEPRFGLRYDEPMLHLRFLSENEKNVLSENIALPLSIILNLENNDIEKVFLITDKNVFLAFPKVENALLVFGEHQAQMLSKIAWFTEKKCFFVGDISPKGFEQLSDLRDIYDELQAILMNKTTFDAFPQHHQTQKTNNLPAFLPNLNKEEQDFYQYLLALSEKNVLMQRDVKYFLLEKEVLLK